MPELPEVETVARGVHERIRGERIVDTWFGGKPEPFKTAPAELAEELTGRRILRVYRVGKHIVFDLAAGHSPTPDRTEKAAHEELPDVQWIVHLGMTGRLLVSDADVILPAHTHAVLRLSSGREVRFVDARRFGRLALQRMRTEPASGAENSSETGIRVQGGFQGTGAEPLSISKADFQRLFRGRHTSIKAALLNQKLLHGVGNIYADESLFRAGIRPRRMAAGLRRAELERLHEALQRVLREAIALGGSSVSDYVDAAGVKGFFQLEHRVYMRTGKPCLVCGAPIRRLIVAGRGTHYCPQCQR